MLGLFVLPRQIRLRQENDRTPMCLLDEVDKTTA